MITRFLPLFASFLLVGATSHAQLGPRPEEFFKPGPSAPENLPADRLYPQGRMFAYSFFSLGGSVSNDEHKALDEAEVQKAFERYRKEGMQVFGPQYEMNKRALEDAGKHDLKVIYSLLYKEPRLFHSGKNEPLDPEDVRRSLSEQVAAVADNPAIVMWYLQPEELRPWRKEEMTFLEAASQAIREADPLKRPVWVYDPAHASAGRLKSIAPYVDYLGKGMYTNYASMQENRVWVRWSMEQELEAIRLADAKSVPLAVPEMYHDSRRPPLEEAAIKRIPDWVRHDVYLSLVSGAKGVVIFSLRKRPSLPPEAWEAYYQAYMKVGKELLEGPKLADVFLFGEERGEIQVDIVEGPAELTLVYPSGGLKEPKTYPSVAHRELQYGKERYLFLVNSANEPVTLMVGGLPYASATADNLFDEAPPFAIGEGEFQVDLAPLEARAYRLQRQ